MRVNDFPVSRNFKLYEFESRDTHEVKIHQEIIRKTQMVRDILGLPVRVNSGYRTPEHNREVGGVPNSLHCEGKAVDLSCAFVPLEQLTIAAIWAEFMRIIVYEDLRFIHCELGSPRRYIVPGDRVQAFKIIFPAYGEFFISRRGFQAQALLDV